MDEALELDDQLGLLLCDVERRLSLLDRVHRVRVRSWLAKLRETVRFCVLYY